MPRWTRIYRSEDQFVRQAGAIVGSLVIWPLVICNVMYPFRFTDTGAGRLLLALAIVLVLGGMFQYFLWQITGQGVYVGEAGIRFRTLIGSQIIPWSKVDRVVVVDDPKYRSRVLTIVTWFGTRIPTPICQFVIRFVRAPGPPGFVMVSRAELDTIAQALDAMMAERKRRVSS